ncbi:replicative DNA helicase [Arsenicicoccus piscis]|uniref:Replicative DNA helicase n=1 Tax=Arsenicicoccus piscis TaxID=673954 RepID=A0ABQ6HVQ8_9MICO|nr:hypothetical protein GCM10025862_36660 [Arsenicicoccus piscis]
MTISELSGRRGRSGGDSYDDGYGEESQLDRTPPQDVDAERSVLGSMMLSKDAIADCVEALRGKDFYRPAHESIFEAILDLYGRGEPADAITVADELTKRGDIQRIGGQAYLHQLIQAVPTAANAGYYAEIVQERAVLRRLVEAGTRIVQMGYGHAGDVEDIVNQAQAEVYGVADKRAAEDYVIIGDILEATVDEIEHAAGSTGEMLGVPTGFTELDSLTNGLHPGQMIVIAARPAMGKSTLALDIARSAAIHHNKATVFFSLEMSKNEITTRLLSAEASLQLQKLRKGQVDDQDWTKIARTVGRLSDAPLFIDDSPNMSLMEIRAKCRRLKMSHNLKLVVIDYLQLMSSGKRVESRQQEVSEFSRALKLLAKEIEVPVIALSQLNRGPEQRTDKKPQVSDLRESGCLTADSRVLRADTGAETTMGELFESGARDVPVWSLDESLRYVTRHLTHVFSTGIKPVFRLTLASGKTIRATENHPFLTYGGWRALGDIHAGDAVAVPQHVPAPRECQPVTQDAIDNWIAAASRGVELPDEVFYAPKQTIRDVVATLWTTHHRVELDEDGCRAVLRTALTGDAVAQQVSRLLLRFGISVRSVAGDGRLVIADPDSQRRFLQEVWCEGEAAANLLAMVRNRSTPEIPTASSEAWGAVSEVLAESDSEEEASAR